MAIENTQFNIFRFYDSLNKQSFRRHQGGDYSTFRLISPYNRLLPFQLQRPTRPQLITTIDLYNAPEDFFELDILSILPANSLEYISIDQFDFISYKALKDLTSDLPNGFHYLVIADAKQTWYSEVFYTSCELLSTVVGERITKADGIEIVLNDIGDIPVFKK